MLSESERLRQVQESEPPPTKEEAASSLSYRVWLYWFGEWDSAKLRVLWQEVCNGTPHSAIVASLCVFCGSLCSMRKLIARGMMLDIMARAVVGVHGTDISWVHLWYWQNGWEGLGALALWSLLEWCCLVGKDVCLGLAKAQRQAQSRALYFASMVRQDLAFHATHPSGELAARLDSDTKVLDELCVHGLERLLQGFVALGTLGWLLAMDPYLLGLALFFRIPQLFQVTELSVRLATAYERLADAKAAAAQARACDSLSNVRLIQANGAEREEVAGYCDLLWERLKVVRSSAIISTLLRHSEGLVLLVTECGLLAFGGYRVMSGQQSVGLFSSRRETTNTVIENFHGLEHVYHMVRRCGLLSGRYLALRDRQPSIPNALPIPLNPMPAPLLGALPGPSLEKLKRNVKEMECWRGHWNWLESLGSEDGNTSPQSNKEEGQGATTATVRGSKRGTKSPRKKISSETRTVPLVQQPLTLPRGEITFEGVSFSYPTPLSSPNGPAPSPSPVLLKNVSFRIPNGSVCAFVGPSGGGKTTVGRLIARYWDCDSGRILLDGVDIKSIPLPFLRQCVGSVDQDTTLLSRSIFENVALGQNGGRNKEGGEGAEVSASTITTRERAWKALESAACSEFLAGEGGSGGGGMDTLVGERGGNLSGGQKQRIALARLLLRDPPVAIIDEGTSALDTQSEALVMNALLSQNSSSSPRTRILIAHRLASIQSADMVLVFKGGRVVEQGTPKELAAHVGGVYWGFLQGGGDAAGVGGGVGTSSSH